MKKYIVLSLLALMLVQNSYAGLSDWIHKKEGIAFHFISNEVISATKILLAAKTGNLYLNEYHVWILCDLMEQLTNTNLDAISKSKYEKIQKVLNKIAQERHTTLPVSKPKWKKFDANKCATLRLDYSEDVFKKSDEFRKYQVKLHERMQKAAQTMSPADLSEATIVEPISRAQAALPADAGTISEEEKSAADDESSHFEMEFSEPASGIVVNQLRQMKAIDKHSNQSLIQKLLSHKLALSGGVAAAAGLAIIYTYYDQIKAALLNENNESSSELVEQQAEENIDAQNAIEKLERVKQLLTQGK